MNRLEFLRLSAGIIGGLGIPGMFGDADGASDARSGPAPLLDASYLEKGLTAMVRARGWFDAHWGAGVLAGYYLCRDNPLGEATTRGIRGQMDAVIRLRASQFAPLPDGPVDPARIEEVPRSLTPAIQGGLRAHGHAVIFASLSTRALRDAPHMARPDVVQGLCGLSAQIARMRPQPPVNPEPFADTRAMIGATFDSLARFRGLLGRPSILRPNFTHMVTHTEALLNLERMGYPALARAGHAGLRTHIAAPVPEFDPATDPAPADASLEAVMSRGYWDDPRNQERWRRTQDPKANPNGDWIAAGHLFKVLYSYHRLIREVDDPAKVELCSKVLLERYVNPEVRGG